MCSTGSPQSLKSCCDSIEVDKTAVPTSPSRDPKLNTATRTVSQQYTDQIIFNKFEHKYCFCHESNHNIYEAGSSTVVKTWYVADTV